MAAAGDPPESRHRIKVRILVVLASIFAFLAIFTTWIDRQLLDTDQWVKTSGEMLEEEVISDAIADYAVDQLFAKVNVAKTLNRRLPEDLKPLSGPISGGARELGTRAAEQALQSPRVQALWRDANRAAHSQLIAILKGDADTVSTNEGRVILDLRPIVLQLAERIGVEKQAEERLPQSIAELDIADAKQLDTARTITRALNGLAWLFSIGTLALFGLAAYLAKGRRWIVVLGYGLGLIAAGLAAIALKNIASGLVIDSLAKTEAARPPAEEAWTIATSLLQSIATTGIVYGVLFVLASYLASPADSAVAVRQALAPPCASAPGRLGAARWRRLPRPDRLASGRDPPADLHPCPDRARRRRPRGPEPEDGTRVPRCTPGRLGWLRCASAPAEAVPQPASGSARRCGSWPRTAIPTTRSSTGSSGSAS